MATTPVIASPAALADLITAWSAEPVVGIDTEAASFHRYRDRVYLLQLSTATDTVVVDPLGTEGIAGLRPWFEGGSTEFVFHDADYDLRLMRYEAGLAVRRHFDTRIAAQFLNLPGIGLGSILEQRFGVATDKRFQRADWSARPLTPDMVAYAANDTRYLPSLRDQFRTELAAIGRLEWVLEECQLQAGVEWGAPEPVTTAFLRLKGARDLSRRELAVLKELFAWRESMAERLDRAVFRVLANETLLLIAQRQPRTVEQLGALRGVGPDNAARRGAEILAAVERGLVTPDRDLPAFERGPRFRPDPAFEARLDRLKRWRQSYLDTIGLPPGLFAPNATLEAVARATPATLESLATVPGIRRWQVKTFGAEILGAVGSG